MSSSTFCCHQLKLEEWLHWFVSNKWCFCVIMVCGCLVVFTSMYCVPFLLTAPAGYKGDTLCLCKMSLMCLTRLCKLPLLGAEIDENLDRRTTRENVNNSVTSSPSVSISLLSTEAILLSFSNIPQKSTFTSFLSMYPSCRSRPKHGCGNISRSCERCGWDRHSNFLRNSNR